MVNQRGRLWVPALRADAKRADTLDRLLRAVDRAGFGRRVWMTTTAVFRNDAAAGSCPHEHTMVRWCALKLGSTCGFERERPGTKKSGKIFFKKIQ